MAGQSEDCLYFQSLEFILKIIGIRPKDVEVCFPSTWALLLKRVISIPVRHPSHAQFKANNCSNNHFHCMPSLSFLASVGRYLKTGLCLVSHTNWKYIFVLSLTDSLFLTARMTPDLVRNRSTEIEIMWPPSVEVLNGARKEQASSLRGVSPPGAQSLTQKYLVFIGQ